MNEKTQYWLDLADYDLETAEAMLQTGRYLYVGFMCHQVIEKALKGVIAETGKTSPHIQNLSKLAKESGVYGLIDDDYKVLIGALDTLNIYRYPEESHRISVALSPERCKSLLTQTDELYDWIRAKL